MFPNNTDIYTVISLRLLLTNNTENPFISGCIIGADCILHSALIHWLTLAHTQAHMLIMELHLFLFVKAGVLFSWILEV